MLYYSDPRSFHLAGYTFWHCMYVLCVRCANERIFCEDSVGERKRENRYIDSSPYSTLSSSFISIRSSLPLSLSPSLSPSYPFTLSLTFSTPQPPSLPLTISPSLSPPFLIPSLLPSLPRLCEWTHVIRVLSKDHSPQRSLEVFESEYGTLNTSV